MWVFALLMEFSKNCVRNRTPPTDSSNHLKYRQSSRAAGLSLQYLVVSNAEAFGVEGRGGYYESAGVVRDFLIWVFLCASFASSASLRRNWPVISSPRRRRERREHAEISD